MPESHGTRRRTARAASGDCGTSREFIGGGELVPHPETAAQTHGWRKLFECCARIWPSMNLHGTREFMESSCRIRRLRRKPIGGANRLRQAYEYSWLSRTERVSSQAAESSCGGELVPHPETAAQTHGWRKPLECWQCENLAMAESHGTREFIGGGELAPHPETAAQTHGWRQLLGNYTENGPARRCVLPHAGGFKKIIIFSYVHTRAVAPNKNRFFSATLARALSRRLSRGVFVACVPPKNRGN